MIVALDVGYADGPTGTSAQIAVVAFADWTAVDTLHEVVAHVHDIAPYVPGRLFERELPCLIAGLDALGGQATEAVEAIEVIIVDANVRLDSAGSPGLGAYLHEHLENRIPVVGVAKNEYAGLDAQRVLRGDSARPLYVTAAGMDETVAAHFVQSMAGEFRLPAMLRRVDLLTRRQSSA